MSQIASTAPSVHRISDRLFVSAQPHPADFTEFAGRGFKAVISNRPAQEEANQPDPADERRAAAVLGMQFQFIPVTSTTITEADVRSFQDAVAAAAGPVLAHCRTGVRSANLHAIGEILDGRVHPADLATLGAEWGIDLAIAARWLAANAAQRPRVKGFFDHHTFSIQYVVVDPQTRRCAIVDPILDFTETSGSFSTDSADRLLDYVAAEGLTIDWILDTHAHADHFTAAHYLHERTGAPTAIGAGVVEVQRRWHSIYNRPHLKADGAAWNHLFGSDERFNVGSIEGRVILSSGHTPASVTFVVGDAAFVHDTLLMPDGGTARADFPGGDARQLWRSLQTILALPDETRLFVGHDYQPNGRMPRWESSVGEQRRHNVHVAAMTEDAFVLMRETRDQTLPLPKLMLHALQVNIAGGRFPDKEENGARYLRIPIDVTAMAAWRE